MMVLDLEILGGASTSGPLLLADRWQQEGFARRFWTEAWWIVRGASEAP